MIGAPMETKGINANGESKAKPSRKEIIEKKKAMDALLRAASSEKDHLSAFPAFRRYQANVPPIFLGIETEPCCDFMFFMLLATFPFRVFRFLYESGLSALLESGRGDKLSSTLKHYIQNLLKANMEGLYGSEWLVEEKVKRREMVAPEARYIFVREASNASASEMLTMSEQERTSASCEERGPMVGFVHFRFVIEEELPVLYVYELQLEPRVQGKGLGKFLMQLIELIARKNHMGAVVLTVQKSNSVAMNLYLSKMRYIISTISPSRVDPLIGIEKSYEILCKAFSNEAKAILEEPLEKVHLA
ncbi:uncharacterized protein LOC126598787 isoform X2 [Malus sylvestris]|uniref:uncharacterized protein LOC126598787 isoform X2 n=1 Tax=Malus sylvestris TaxID=3752 RepID=UPI0021AC510F|nr:uncharacterized protein LOC126598787 isoform X2 [Malus sylvestris]